MPPGFPGNDRARCGSDSLSPINLTPWLERDPFHKEADFSSSNHIDPVVGLFLPDNNNPFSSTTFRPSFSGISNHLDFNEIITKATTKRTKPSTSFNNNLDFTAETLSSTTTRPRRKRTTTTKRPAPTIIDNKIDFSTTKRPFESPFSKSFKKSNTTKRSTDNNNSHQKVDKLEHRTDIDTRLKTFRNEDNATKYEDNKAITVKFDNDTIESRVNHNFYGGVQNDYYPLYQPYMTTKRPTAYENNQPNFFRPETATRPTPISNKLSGPFSYDTVAQKKPPKTNYDNMAVPLYVSPNRHDIYRPQYNYQTTRKMDLTTFLIIQTTRRTTPSFYIEPVTKKPSNFPSSIYISSSSSLNTNANHFLNQYSITNRPLPPQDDYYDDDNFDGYLRPDFNAPPYKGQNNYYDYKKYNFKPDTTTVKYYFIKNRLHKYQNIKSKENDDTTDESLNKRTSEEFDEQLKDSGKDDIVTLTKDTRTEDLQGRSKSNIFANTQFVPFRLLTRPERPDNWINVEDTTTDNDKRLPDVPNLTQDDNFARELPKPFGSKIFNNAHDN